MPPSYLNLLDLAQTTSSIHITDLKQYSILSNSISIFGKVLSFGPIPTLLLPGYRPESITNNNFFQMKITYQGTANVKINDFSM